MSHGPAKRFDPFAAIGWGAITGIAIAYAGMIGWAAATGPGMALDSIVFGALALAAWTLIIGSVLAFPTAITMVLTLNALIRWFPRLDRLWIWAAAGGLFTVPVAMLGGKVDSPESGDVIAFGPLWWYCVMLGTVSGVSARWFGRLDKDNQNGYISDSQLTAGTAAVRGDERSAQAPPAGASLPAEASAPH